MINLTNLDDGTLENTFNILYSRQTGIGTSRDKTNSYQISNINLLNEFERNSIVRSSRIARKAVTLFPLEATRGWCEITSVNTDFTNDALQNYWDNLGTGSLREAFKDASIEGRWHGDGYILLGVDDGENWDKPIKENNIKSLRWVEPLSWNEVTPDSSYNIRKPTHYWLTVGHNRDLPELKNKANRSSVRVHHTRILRFPGDKLYGSALIFNGFRNDSILQTMFNAFASYLQGVMASSAMLQDYSVFKYKLKNLAKLVQQGNSDAILQRFLTIQMGMSVVKGLAMDADDEDAEFVSRNYGGVKDILDTLLDQLVFSSDVPRYKLLGDNSTKGTGQGTRAEQERYDWAASINSWQIDNWRDNLKYVCRLSFLAKDGVTKGNLPKLFEVIFPNTFQMSPSEEIEIKLKKAQENKINIDAGIYTALEARLSGYGAAIWNSSINLEDEETERMRSHNSNIKEKSNLEKIPSFEDNIKVNEDSEDILEEGVLETLTEISEIDILSVLNEIST